MRCCTVSFIFKTHDRLMAVGWSPAWARYRSHHLLDYAHQASLFPLKHLGRLFFGRFAPESWRTTREAVENRSPGNVLSRLFIPHRLPVPSSKSHAAAAQPTHHRNENLPFILPYCKRNLGHDSLWSSSGIGHASARLLSAGQSVGTLIFLGRGSKDTRL
ncbi:hypothetical protein DL98DRAFT_55193 [Cadophora sp. DSE1049]|nr:hypothetical protein DL98DRAFT_55193 [Cadophora sp. DSE1049]